MKEIKTSAERLIVAADFNPAPEEIAGTNTKRIRDQIRWKVLDLADLLQGTGVYLKVNSALRACGYDLIDQIHSRGLKVFADLKLYEVRDTLSTDGRIIAEVKPDLLTVVCVTGMVGMEALKKELPGTEILGVTVLTDHTEQDILNIFCADIEASAMKLAMIGEEAGIDGFISSAKEVPLIKSVIHRPMTFNAPAIRPLWSVVANDGQNQKRVVTPAEAMKLGADRIVVGRPIVQNSDPRAAVLRTIEEIEQAFST